MPRVVRNVAIYAGAILSVSFIMQGCSSATKTTTPSGDGRGKDPSTTPSGSATTPIWSDPSTTPSGSATTPIWSYRNNSDYHVSPPEWYTLDGNNKCKDNGPRQSPVNIDTGLISSTQESSLQDSLDFDSYDLSNCPLKYSYSRDNWADTVMRNEFEVLHHECNATFSINGRTENKLNCTLKHFHMHFKSEHTIDGKHKDGELHLVHGCDDNTVVVIGMLMEKAKKENIGEVNFFGTEYLNKSLEYGGKFPRDGPKTTLPPRDNPKTTLPFDSLFDQKGRAPHGPFAGTYFNYMGSLTTPPCTESVTWIVTNDTLKVNATMFDQLAKRLRSARSSRARFEDGKPESNRNIQDLGDRTISQGELLIDEIFPAVPLPAPVPPEGPLPEPLPAPVPHRNQHQ